MTDEERDSRDRCGSCLGPIIRRAVDTEVGMVCIGCYRRARSRVQADPK